MALLPEVLPRFLKQGMRLSFSLQESLLMQHLMGQIEQYTLFDDPRIRQSLRCMQCDYSEGKLKIYGNYSHIFEALKRAAHCMKDKTLNIYIY